MGTTQPGSFGRFAVDNTPQTLRRTTLQIALAGALFSVSTLGLVPSHAAAVEAHVENAGIFTAQIPVEGSKIATGQAIIVVDKPIEEVLKIVLDYANYVKFMPNFTKSRVLAQRGSRAMVYMEVSVAKGMYTLYGQLNLAERPQDGVSRVVEGRLMDGNIDAFDATFKLTPTDDGTGTEIDFRINVDPDLPLPSSVFSRENERAAGRTVRALRARVAEAPGGST